MPEFTAFDMVTQLTAAAVYLSVGLAALVHAPRDVRTRVFAAFSTMQVVAVGIMAGGWFLGEKDPLAFKRVPLALVLSALSVGAILMFHFSQVFPRRRPWIIGSGPQLPIAYALTPIAVFLLVAWWPATAAEATPQFGLVFVVFGFPLMVLLGLVLPVASIVSLLHSLREAGPRHGDPRWIGRVDGESHDTGEPIAPIRPASAARVPLAGIILSQLAGGALSVLVLGPLTVAAPESMAVGVVAIAVWLLGLLTPAAFAAGVWKYGVLETATGGSAEVEPN
jgi:hypothetical protein